MHVGFLYSNLFKANLFHFRGHLVLSISMYKVWTQFYLCTLGL